MLPGGLRENAQIGHHGGMTLRSARRGRPMPCTPVVAVLGLVVAALVAPTPSRAQAFSCANTTREPASIAEARSATLCLLNVERRRHDLAPLRSQSRLQRAATRYSHAMVTEEFFAHVGPDGSTVQTRLADAGYGGWWTIGENIAWGSGTLSSPAQIVDGWMNSPGHRANILRPEFRQIGIGIARGAPQQGIPGDAAVYTTDFARPR
jgi:uncharacterized protein YkwD